MPLTEAATLCESPPFREPRQGMEVVPFFHLDPRRRGDSCASLPPVQRPCTNLYQTFLTSVARMRGVRLAVKA